MQGNNRTQENQSAGVKHDAQIISAVRAAVEKTLREMGVEAKPHAASGLQGTGEGRPIDLVGLMLAVLDKFYIVLLAAAVGAALFAFAMTTCTATAKLYIVNPADAGISAADLQLGSALTLDYQEVFKTWEVHEMVRRELDLPWSYDTMQSMLTVTNPKDTRLLYISVTCADAQMAADMANAYARAAKEFIIHTMRGEAPSDFSIAIVPGMGQAAGRSRPALMGILLGGALAVAALALFHVFDERPRTPEDISDFGGIPTLAILPSVKGMRRAYRREKKHREKIHREKKRGAGRRQPG